MVIERVGKARKKCDFISNVLMHIIAHVIMLCKQKEENSFFLWWLANINIIFGLFSFSMLTHNARFLAILAWVLKVKGWSKEGPIHLCLLVCINVLEQRTFVLAYTCLVKKL